MKDCSVVKKLEIVAGGIEDYRGLGRYHYRDGRLGPYAAVFALRSKRNVSGGFGVKTVGVIVYTMPSPGLELRNVAMGDYFVGFDRSSRLALVNRNIRCISRVIIEPRFRGLGLASRLVRETMGKLNVPIIEGLAVMGTVNPFFEKAGMRAYTGKAPMRCVQLIEAFSMVGVEKEHLIDSRKVQRRLERLCKRVGEFIEFEIGRFLQSYGKRRLAPASPERMRFVLSKLTVRPVYYVWFNSSVKAQGMVK